MKLIIDIGNTRIKAGLFEKNELKELLIFTTTDELLDSELFSKYPISHCIVGSVVNGLETFYGQLQQKTNVFIFTAATPTPIVNKYASAHTLGSDRLAGAVGGNALAPNQNVLVIDAGTCIKYNFVNDRNEYIGGGISPGLQMRFKAMNTFTSRLPLLETDTTFDKLVGTDSRESILSGVQMGVVAEVDGLIDQYRQGFNNLKVFLTGGDYQFFEKRLKNRIFADPILILKGLNAILEHNIN